MPDKLVIYHHGHGEDETAISTEPLKADVIAALRAAGYAVAGSQAHDSNWGNQLCMDDYVSFSQYMIDKYGSRLGKIYFLSQSMGGLSGLLNLIAGNIPVVGWCGIYPICNLRAMYDQGSYTSYIKDAYGIAVDGSDYDTKTAGHDPVLHDAMDFPAIRYRFYASAGDTLAVKADNTDPFRTLISTRAIEYDLVTCTGDHGDPSHFQPSDVVSFFNRC